MRLLIILALISFPSLAQFEEIFSKIKIENELDGSEYDRKKHFGDWIDEDGDGKSTRQEVLEQESLIPVTWSADGKKVLTGFWYDPFTQKNFVRPNRTTGNKYAILQIDHIVPLKEAWESGAKNWTKAQRVEYANDMKNFGHLIAVRGGTNGAKGAKDPEEWTPPNGSFDCAYVITWSAIKAKWSLSMDTEEYAKIMNVLSECKFEQ